MFPDEGNLKLFDYYTENNCLIECAWSKAQEICGCKPWHVPSADGEEMCFVLGQVCFDQIMAKIEKGSIDVDCACEPDCTFSRYSLSVQDKFVLERLTTRSWSNITHSAGFHKIGTDEMEGNDMSGSHWYNMGEYLKDLDQILIPQDPLLENKVPVPLMERGYCYGTWTNFETNIGEDEFYTYRDCNTYPNTEYEFPLSRYGSRVKKDIN